MKRNALKLIVVLALISVTGIFLLQFAFLKNIFKISEKQLQESTTVALREVAWQILQASGQTSKFDNIDPVEMVTTNYYLVNVNDIIDPEILKSQLKEQFKRHDIRLDYEYAIFDPGKRKMVYGEYICASGDSCEHTPQLNFPLSSKYTYYFGVNFPKPLPYLNYRIQGWYLLSGLLFVILIFFGYSLWVIIRQRQLSETQKVFINNLTHELKTPISSIGLSAQVISDEKIIENPARLFEYVRIINEQSNRLARNVEKVLNLTTLEKNRLQLVREHFNLKDFTEKAIVRFQQSELGSNAAVTFREPEGNLLVWADKFHLGNVIQNILENAVKYCRKSPEIKVTMISKKKKIHLMFKDNGIGIPREDRKKIFRKFNRVPTGNVHDVKGFGLGLDYVKTIVKAHRWRIRVDANEEGGSVFTLIIPFDNE